MAALEHMIFACCFNAGGADLLSDSRDIDALTSGLPPEYLAEVLIEPSYEHLDFVWGMDARILIYPSIKRLLQHYSVALAAL